VAAEAKAADIQKSGLEITNDATTLAGVLSAAPLLFARRKFSRKRPAGGGEECLCWCTAASWTGPVGGRVQSSERGWVLVTIVQMRPSRWPTTSPQQRAIAAQKGPVILVGHSYGGAVITEAGNDPMSRGWCMSLPSRRTKASRWPHDQGPPAGGAVPPFCRTRRLSTARQGEVPRGLCGRRPAETAAFHGRLAVPWAWGR